MSQKVYRFLNELFERFEGLIKTKLLKNIQTIFIKSILVVLVIHLLLFCCKLGWYLVYLWGTGGIITILITKPQWRNSGHKLLAFVILIYILLVGIVSKIFLDQKSYKTFIMIWTDKGIDNRYTVPEIVFQFKDYPTDSVGIYSDDVAHYVHQLLSNKVSVTFETIGAFGCVGGINETQIGDLKQWKSMDGYYSSNSNDTREHNPFGNSWWCY